MKKTFLCFALLLVVAIHGQQMKLLAGDYANLKGISEYNVTFNYDNLKVDRLSEQDFLDVKMKKYGNPKAETFKATWFSDRESRYEPKFVESFNKRFSKASVKANEGATNAKYTMDVKTTWIHPGFNVFIMHNSSLLNTVVSVFETANPSNILLEVQYDRVPGKGIFVGFGFLDYNTGYRISEGYAKLAKTIAANINKTNKT